MGSGETKQTGTAKRDAFRAVAASRLSVGEQTWLRLRQERRAARKAVRHGR